MLSFEDSNPYQMSRLSLHRYYDCALGLYQCGKASFIRKVPCALGMKAIGPNYTRAPSIVASSSSVISIYYSYYPCESSTVQKLQIVVQYACLQTKYRSESPSIWKTYWE